MIRRCDGLATTGELLTVMTRQQLDVQVRKGGLIRVWRGVYSVAQPDLLMRLRALDLLIGGHAVACMHTAAALYGFCVEKHDSVHVLDSGSRLRLGGELVVHQREGAPLQLISSRSATSPAWTAVEVARQVRRPRALATLDAALHSGWCSAADLAETMDRHRGRRGIVAVRNLLPLVDGRAESAMESEARLVMLDHGLTAKVGGWTSPGRRQWWRRNTTACNGMPGVRKCCGTRCGSPECRNSGGPSSRSWWTMCDATRRVYASGSGVI